MSAKTDCSPGLTVVNSIFRLEGVPIFHDSVAVFNNFLLLQNGNWNHRLRMSLRKVIFLESDTRAHTGSDGESPPHCGNGRKPQHLEHLKNVIVYKSAMQLLRGICLSQTEAVERSCNSCTEQTMLGRAGQ